mmetsp:Transcript_44568/g.53500  ORF Transcript_44568/g.53500 Transcript_44568/m.53500 type:complete len:285 (+) Transcript_44568:97-951(+)
MPPLLSFAGLAFAVGGVQAWAAGVKFCGCFGLRRLAWVAFQYLRLDTGGGSRAPGFGGRLWGGSGCRLRGGFGSLLGAVRSFELGGKSGSHQTFGRCRALRILPCRHESGVVEHLRFLPSQRHELCVFPWGHTARGGFCGCLFRRCLMFRGRRRAFGGGRTNPGGAHGFLHDCFTISAAWCSHQSLLLHRGFSGTRTRTRTLLHTGSHDNGSLGFGCRALVQLREDFGHGPHRVVEHCRFLPSQRHVFRVFPWGHPGLFRLGGFAGGFRHGFGAGGFRQRFSAG